MAARGMLSNPAMFSGHPTTPPECIYDWVKNDILVVFIITQIQVDLALSVGTSFNCFHHHLAYMAEEVMNKPGK